MKQTNEQLISEVARLKQSHEEWVSGNERRKKEFAKIFNWFKPYDRYPEERLPAEPSWEQIFTEVGKLLAARTFYNFEGNISELECRLDDLEKIIKKEIHPNL